MFFLSLKQTNDSESWKIIIFVFILRWSLYKGLHGNLSVPVFKVVVLQGFTRLSLC